MSSQATSIKIRYETLRSIAFGDISGGYSPVGSSFENAVRMIKVTNTTDADMIISYDGSRDMDVIPARTAQILDYGSNKTSVGGQLDQSLGERLYVRQESSSPTLGSVYATIIYASAS